MQCNQEIWVLGVGFTALFIHSCPILGRIQQDNGPKYSDEETNEFLFMAKQ